MLVLRIEKKTKAWSAMSSTDVVYEMKEKFHCTI